jgi:hypothetical protein
MTPEEWYALLNSYVFFWLTEARLSRLLTARPYRSLEHDVLTLETSSVVREYDRDIRLAPYNTGTTAYEPPPRGRETFKTIGDYPYDEWRVKRGKADAIVELVVPGQVSPIVRHVLRVERRRGNALLETLYAA